MVSGVSLTRAVPRVRGGKRGGRAPTTPAREHGQVGTSEINEAKSGGKKYKEEKRK